MVNDIKVLNEHRVGTIKMRVEDRTTSTHDFTIKPGEVVEKGASGAVAASGNFAVLALGASPVDGTNLLIGICKEESDETTALDGHGVFYLMEYGVRLRGKATTPGNIDTQAKFDALVLDNVTFDGIADKGASPVTTPYTINENEGDDPNVHGLQIINGDIEGGTLEVRVVAGTCLFGNGI